MTRRGAAQAVSQAGAHHQTPLEPTSTRRPLPLHPPPRGLPTPACSCHLTTSPLGLVGPRRVARSHVASIEPAIPAHRQDGRLTSWRHGHTPPFDRQRAVRLRRRGRRVIHELVAHANRHRLTRCAPHAAAGRPSRASTCTNTCLLTVRLGQVCHPRKSKSRRWTHDTALTSNLKAHPR